MARYQVILLTKKYSKGPQVNKGAQPFGSNDNNSPSGLRRGIQRKQPNAERLSPAANKNQQ